MNMTYHAVERSSYFSVKDKASFVAEINAAEVDWWEGHTISTEDKLAVRGSPCFPAYVVKEDKTLLGFNIKHIIQKHIVEDEAAVLVGVSSEGMRHIEGWASVVTTDKIEQMSLSDWVSVMMENMEVTATDFNY